MNVLERFINSWQINTAETAVRSLAKAYSYRLCGTLITIVISFVVTGQIVVSLAIGATEMVLKPFIYWCHERVWSRVRWGRR